MSGPPIHHVFCFPDGSVSHLYADGLTLTQLGPTHIRRASQIEPTADSRGWHVTLADTGRLLAVTASREEALQQEVKWLTQQILPRQRSANEPL
jgi:hypothetical protein